MMHDTFTCFVFFSVANASDRNNYDQKPNLEYLESSFRRRIPYKAAFLW